MSFVFLLEFKNFSKSFKIGLNSLYSKPFESYKVRGEPFLCISSIVWVTGFPCPVFANSPPKIALIKVLFPTPVLP